MSPNMNLFNVSMKVSAGFMSLSDTSALSRSATQSATRPGDGAVPPRQITRGRRARPCRSHRAPFARRARPSVAQELVCHPQRADCSNDELQHEIMTCSPPFERCAQGTHEPRQSQSDRRQETCMFQTQARPVSDGDHDSRFDNSNGVEKYRSVMHNTKSNESSMQK